MKSKDQLLLEQAYEEICEALDNPYPYHFSEDDNGMVFYPDPDNKQVYYTVQMLRYGKNADSPSENGRTLEILFDFNNEASKQYGVTLMTNANTGDQFRIMATIKAVVMKYLQKIPKALKLITFTSKNHEKGKTRLYTKLGQMLAHMLGSEWAFETMPGTGEDEGAVKFNITKRG